MVKKTRVLHVSYSKEVPSGVINQLKYELEAVKELGIEWDTKLFTTSKLDLEFVTKINGKYPAPIQWLIVYVWLLKNQSKYDVILLRNIKADLVGWLFIPFIKNIWTIHHTKEIEECAIVSPSWYGCFLSKIENMFGWLKLKNVYGIGAVTGEIANYEISRIGKPKPQIIIPNGIEISSGQNHIDKRSKSLKAMFIASHFEKWHGLELILESYIEKQDIDLELFIVGCLTEEQEEKVDLINKKKKKIYKCGYLQKKEINEIILQSDLGLSSFAMEKSSLTEACTLKVREYLSMGLPVYAGHNDSGLPDAFPYFIKGNADIEVIANYAEKFRDVEREKICQSSTPFIDKKEILKRAYKKLDQKKD